DHSFYAISSLDGGESLLNRIDITNFHNTVQVVSDLGHGFSGGLVFDFRDGNLYAIATDGAASALYAINRQTWAVIRLLALGAHQFTDGFAVMSREPHTYPEESSGPLSVHIKDLGGSQVTAASTFTVIDEPPVALAPPVIAAFQGFPTGPLTLASFALSGGTE